MPDMLKNAKKKSEDGSPRLTDDIASQAGKTEDQRPKSGVGSPTYIGFYTSVFRLPTSDLNY